MTWKDRFNEWLHSTWLVYNIDLWLFKLKLKYLYPDLHQKLMNLDEVNHG